MEIIEALTAAQELAPDEKTKDELEAIIARCTAPAPLAFSGGTPPPTKPA